MPCADDHYYRGYKLSKSASTGQWDVAYYQNIPSQIHVDKQFILRGQERFQHLLLSLPRQSRQWQRTGEPAVLKLTKTNEAVWAPAANLQAAGPDGKPVFGPEQYEDGRLFNTISNGKGNMPGYSTQIDVKDRWAIVAYVRALQLSQNAPLEALPPSQRDNLR